MPLRLYRHPRSPNWYIRGTIRGVKVEESTGVADRESADAFRAKREWEIIQGAISGRGLHAKFLDAHISYLENKGEKRFLGRILDVLGAVPLAQIDNARIKAVADLLYPGASNATINRQVYTPISAVLHHAAKRKLCEMPSLDRPQQPKGRVRWLTLAEAECLIAACAPHLRPLVVFLLYTGARLGEALALEWREVHLERRHVTFLDTKNGEDRGVPLAPRVLIELANIPHRMGPVFRRQDGMPYPSSATGGGQIASPFGGACKRAGIADFSPHDCRHTWATWHYAANRDLLTLMKLGGWKSERMVLRYAHVNVDNMAESMSALPGAGG